MEELIIFDTTLRDGEQSPGVTLNIDEKVIIAKQLYLLGVDVLEAGFPICSPDDFKAVSKIAEEINLMEDRDNGPMTICALARCCKKDIDCAYEAIKDAKKHRIHVFLATSDIHLKYKLKISRKECLEQIKNMVLYATSLCNDIEFSSEDASRTDMDFLIKASQVAIDAGATTINVPDTVGYTTPNEMYDIFTELRKECPAPDITWSTHCHNDLGLATANTLAGISAGARQVEVTINGIGERAGNTSLEEVVMTLHTRQHLYPVKHCIKTTEIMKTSRMVSSLTGMSVQPNKAIVGTNAFAHEAGIHQDGIIKNRLTYEIMTPESIGLSSNKLVLGKHSGRAAFKKRICDMGYSNITDLQVTEIVNRFKNLTDNKKHITDDDIEALIMNQILNVEHDWKITEIHINSSNQFKTEATVCMTNKNRKYTSKLFGNGAIDATYNCINQIVRVNPKLQKYNVESITSGFDALGRVTVKITDDDNNTLITACSTHNDIIMASGCAYVNAINRMLSRTKKPTSASTLISRSTI